MLEGVLPAGLHGLLLQQHELPRVERGQREAGGPSSIGRAAGQVRAKRAIDNSRRLPYSIYCDLSYRGKYLAFTFDETTNL